MRHLDLEKYYLPALKGKESGAVLDFGSGPGRIINFLSENGFHAVTGFERNESWKKELSGAAAKSTAFGSDAIKFLAEHGQRWDAVILKDVLYYFEDAAGLEFLKTLRSHMNSSSILLVEIFNGAHFTAVYTKNKDRGIQRVFTEHSLRSIVEEAGFHVDEVVGMKPPVSGARSLAYWFASRIWQALLKIVFWMERGTDSQNPEILEKKIFLRASVR